MLLEAEEMCASVLCWDPGHRPLPPLLLLHSGEKVCKKVKVMYYQGLVHSN